MGTRLLPGVFHMTPTILLPRPTTAPTAEQFAAYLTARGWAGAPRPQWRTTLYARTGWEIAVPDDDHPNRTVVALRSLAGIAASEDREPWQVYDDVVSA